MEGSGCATWACADVPHWTAAHEASTTVYRGPKGAPLQGLGRSGCEWRRPVVAAEAFWLIRLLRLLWRLLSWFLECGARRMSRLQTKLPAALLRA